MFKQMYALLAGLLSFPLAVCAQLDTTYKLRETIVTANKFEENSRYVARKVEVMDSNALRQSFTNTTAGLLEQSGKVFVQRSQMGGGSPVLRGFEASRILLMVDGVRMNNAIYRTGHLQNVITIDDDILEKAEVLFGPASTIYGSDALGGVIHFQTKKPLFSPDNLLQVRSNVSGRYSSAYGEYTAHAAVNLGLQKFASLTSVSFSRFGDLRQGNVRNPFYGDFGKRSAYVAQINGMDSIARNTDGNIQKGSGYRQLDLLQKFAWAPAANSLHSLNLQYSTSSDIPRYDRLTDVRNGKLRWAEWYYGPQNRLMASYQYRKENMRCFFDRLLIAANYQHIEESRIQRAYRKPERQHRMEAVDVVAFNADLHRRKGRHEIITGMDAQLNFLKSVAFRKNIATNETNRDIDTRYPDGRNNMNYTGAYVQHVMKLVPGRLILNDGVRLNYVSLHSRFTDTSILHLPFTEAKQRNITYSLNAGLIYLPDAQTKLSFNTSSGFRAPNIDDLAKVFESAGGTQLVLPNPDLKPEQTFNFEADLSRTVNGWLSVSATGFYTLFRNAIVLDKFSVNGRDSVMYDGQLTPVVANQNKAGAYIYGFQGSAVIEPVKDLSLYSHITYTFGRYKGADGLEVPMDHIPPVFGKTGIRYKYSKLHTDLYAIYNGWKYLEDYNPAGEDNLQYATAYGMPAWMTFNVSAYFTFNKNIQAQVAVENILDQNYRVFSSGISGAGRNLVLKLRANF